MSLVRCDIPGCETLVEVYAMRCGDHRQRWGRHPEAIGTPGHTIPKAQIIDCCEPRGRLLENTPKKGNR